MMENEQMAQCCPVCGANNQCAMAAGGDTENCWCYSVTISAEALAAIPEADIGTRCLCPACASDKGEALSER